jgi:hypothetical protein
MVAATREDSDTSNSSLPSSAGMEESSGGEESSESESDVRSSKFTFSEVLHAGQFALKAHVGLSGCHNVFPNVRGTGPGSKERLLHRGSEVTED